MNTDKNCHTQVISSCGTAYHFKLHITSLLVDHHMNYYFESRLGIEIIFDFIWSISCHHELLLTGRNLQHDVYNRNIEKLPSATTNSELFWNSDPLNAYFSTF